MEIVQFDAIVELGHHILGETVQRLHIAGILGAAEAAVLLEAGRKPLSSERWTGMARHAVQQQLQTSIGNSSKLNYGVQNVIELRLVSSLKFCDPLFFYLIRLEKTVRVFVFSTFDKQLTKGCIDLSFVVRLKMCV